MASGDELKSRMAIVAGRRHGLRYESAWDLTHDAADRLCPYACGATWRMLQRDLWSMWLEAEEEWWPQPGDVESAPPSYWAHVHDQEG